MDEILTLPEIAAYLKVSRTTVWRWCNEGKLNGFRLGRSYRVHRTELERHVGQSLGESKGDIWSRRAD
jgi:excisionase family DNA binding protein